MKLCPVCNHNDIHIFEEGIARKDDNEFWFTEIPETIIECNCCGHEVRGYSKEEAVQEWEISKASDWELEWWRRMNND